MLKVPDPIPDLKEQLRREIVALVGHWEPFVAARRLGTDQPRLSDLKRGRLERFSLQGLIRMLANVEQSVEIAVVGSTRITMFRVRNQPAGWTPRPIGSDYATRQELTTWTVIHRRNT
jgi:predicted XRE-type DNA-binding protein